MAKAILELGHIPVGMEMFSAADEQQWQLIQRHIQQCDYYVVIVAHRYGSLAGDISYTEREYDYALENKIPVLGFIIEEGAAWPTNRVDIEVATAEKLKHFKAKIQKKVVSYWSNADQLNTKVIAALSKQFVLFPQPGWVRSNDLPTPQALAEFARLSEENKELRQASATLATPEFEIMAARLILLNNRNHRRLVMSLIVHYEGNSLYIPIHRCKLILEQSSGPRSLTYQVSSFGGGIERQGAALIINGSGAFGIVSIDVIQASDLGDLAEAKFEINFRIGLAKVFVALLKVPEWAYGEPGVIFKD